MSRNHDLSEDLNDKTLSLNTKRNVDTTLDMFGINPSFSSDRESPLTFKGMAPTRNNSIVMGIDINEEKV